MDITMTIIEIVVFAVAIYVVGLLLTAIISRIPFEGKSLSDRWKDNDTVNFNLSLWFLFWIFALISYIVDLVMKLGIMITYAGSNEKEDKKR